MTQVEDIKKFLVSDTIFNKINSRFISMDPDDMKYNNQILKQLFDKLINAMRMQSPLFAKTFQRIVWAGSFYKGTRFGQPEEYDLNLVINLPFKERDVKVPWHKLKLHANVVYSFRKRESLPLICVLVVSCDFFSPSYSTLMQKTIFASICDTLRVRKLKVKIHAFENCKSHLRALLIYAMEPGKIIMCYNVFPNLWKFRTNRPGFIKIHTVWKDRISLFTNMDPKACRELNSFIDEESYLNQEKFRTWMEGIFSKVANATGGKDRIKLDGYAPIKMIKSGPAFTLKFLLNSGKNIDIDVVPVLAFSTCTLPPRCSKMDILQFYSSKCWSAVPKPLNNSRSSFDVPHRYWRLCFYEFEKDFLSSHDYQGMKPVIRQLKKLRDTQNWKSIASYYLETLCYNEKDMFHISQKKSLTFLFFTMLEKLRDAFRDRCITYYWDDELNLLENIGFDEMNNMKGRLENVLRNIRRDIENDQYAIAKWVLNGYELNILKSNLENASFDNQNSASEIESGSESELSSQWSCVII